MTKNIVVPIDDLFGEFDTETQSTVQKNFGMDIPTHVQIELSEPLIYKMKKVQELITENKLSEVSFYSILSNIENNHLQYRSISPSPETVTLLKNGVIIPVSSFREYDKEWPTFDSQGFSLSCQRIYSCQFQAHFYYKNSWTNFSFSTERFSI